MKYRHDRASTKGFAACIATALLIASCGSSETAVATKDSPDGGADAGYDAPLVVADDEGGLVVRDDAGIQVGPPYLDFPTAPVIDTTDGGPSVPTNAADLFRAATGAGSAAPCLIEPEEETLLPKNWLRPRFKFAAVNPAANLFEIRVHASEETNDLVAYAATPTFTMPKDMWTALAQHVTDRPITVSVRAATSDGTSLTDVSTAATRTFTIAPVEARGSIVYWTTSDGTALRGFSPGDEGVVPVLRARDLETPCIGCHASTPDGEFVGYAYSMNTNGDGSLTSLSLRSANGSFSPATWLPTAATNILARQSQQFSVFSPGHWSPGDKVLVTTLISGATWDLEWVDLEATSEQQGMGWGVLARNGDPGHQPVQPSFSHDGKHVAYASGTVNGTVKAVGADVYVVDYGNRQGGTAAPVAGANDPAFNEYYPSYSPDDQWLAFSRAATSAGDSYDQPQAEVLVVPAAGGTATRLRANDPPACTNRHSPGITNSWPKWSPVVTTYSGSTYYFLIFSSRRSLMANPQLYLTSVVVQNGQVTTHGAVHIWNQDEAEDNHTPSWDTYQIPPVPIIPR